MFGFPGDETCGAFNVPCPSTNTILMVIASSGEGWDHVSVSLKNRCPNWTEMDYIKRKFFADNETVMQLHPPVNDHISFCHTALHLWRPNDGRIIPRPPNELVGAPIINK
jgi:hypothetical protein